MCWQKITFAGIVFATLTGGLTGCTPVRSMLVNRPYEDYSPVTPGQSKDGSGLAQAEDPAVTPAVATDLGKSAGPVTDDEGRDSAVVGAGGPISLAGERARQFPLTKEQQVRRASEDSTPPKILPPKATDVEGNAPRPLIPINPEGKTPPEGSKVIPSPYISVRKPGMDVAYDPNLRSTPTASGALLNLGPNDSGVERAVELAKLLDAAEAEKQHLASRVKLLESALENREKMLREDEAEITKASQDLVESRAELQRLRDEFIKLRAKFRQVEKDDLDTLRTVIQALEKLLEAPPPG